MKDKLKNYIFIFFITLILITSSSVNAIPESGMKPVVIENPSPPNISPINERLLKERIIMLSGEITDELANSIIAQMLYLGSEDNSQPIYLYINSPGGSVVAGMGIYDTIEYIRCDVITVNMDLAASMGGFLLASGTPGKRFALKDSRVMLHQPIESETNQGRQVISREIEQAEISRTKNYLMQTLAKMTGQPIEKINKDTQQDFWLSAQEAKEYGIVDSVIDSISQLKEDTTHER